MGLLEDAAKWLEGQTRAHLSVPVLYRRGDGTEREMRAVVGTTLFQADDGYGVVTSVESRDFIISAGDLPDEPEKGDAVVWAGRTYEVLAPSGAPCWRWSDPYHVMRRVHTKETGKEEEHV